MVHVFALHCAQSVHIVRQSLQGKNIFFFFATRNPMVTTEARGEIRLSFVNLAHVVRVNRALTNIVHCARKYVVFAFVTLRRK